MPQVSAAKGQPVVLQNNATTGNGQAVAVPSSIDHHVFYVRGTTGVSAGAVSLETASSPDYTGTWAPLVNDLATPTTNPVVVVADTDKIYAYRGALAAVRARISTTISGGGAPGVTVTYLAT